MTTTGQATGWFSPLLRKWRNRQTAGLIADGSRVLDIGCGTASLLDELYRQGKRRIAYVGVDLRADCIQLAAARYPEQRFLVGNVAEENLIGVGEGFDVICLIALIEHINKPVELLRTLTARLAAGGRMLLTTPVEGNEKIYRLGARLGLFSKEADEEHWDTFASRATLENLAQGAGLRMTRYQRFLFGRNQLAELRPPVGSKGEPLAA